MMNRIDRFTSLRENNEGILSASLPATTGRWTDEEFMAILDMLVESGLNQLLTIQVHPEAFKAMETAPAEIRVSHDGLMRGLHTDTMFPNIVYEIRKRYPDLAMVVSGNIADFILYGFGRAYEKAKEVGYDGMDMPLYPALTDEFQFRKMSNDLGIHFFNCVHIASFPHLNEDPEQRALYEELIATSKGELFLVPALPSTNFGFDGEYFKTVITDIREVQKKYDNTDCKIICIGGVNTPEDVNQLVRIGGADGVHFSSAVLNRLLNGDSLESISAFLKDIKAAMRK